MKKLFFLISSALLLIACSSDVVKTIQLSNPTDDVREGEMVEVCAKALGLTADADFETLGLYDEAGNLIPYQVMHYGQPDVQSIVFQATLQPQSEVAYTLRKSTPLKTSTQVSARFVPERKDDFAWENDIAAYRMYGPALAPENPSNGIDLWLKKTDLLIVDTFYYREHTLGLPYHVDYGKGLDCYKVGHTAGCGGVFPVMNGLPQIGNHYDSWQVIDEGPLRVVFCLTYNDYFANGQAPVVETFTVTCDAHQPLCRAQVMFAPADSTSPLFDEIGAGIFLHTATANPEIGVDGQMQIGESTGYLAYAENAVSDAGLASGRNYAAVVLPGMKEHATADGMLYGKADYEMGETYTYYFGGGWSEWKYPTDADWFEAIAKNARSIAAPIAYTIQ